MRWQFMELLRITTRHGCIERRLHRTGPLREGSSVGGSESRDLHQEVPSALARDDERGRGMERRSPWLVGLGDGTRGFAPLSVGTRAAALIVAVAGIRAQALWQRLLAVLADLHFFIVARRGASLLIGDNGR